MVWKCYILQRYNTTIIHTHPLSRLQLLTRGGKICIPFAKQASTSYSSFLSIWIFSLRGNFEDLAHNLVLTITQEVLDLQNLIWVHDQNSDVWSTMTLLSHGIESQLHHELCLRSVDMAIVIGFARPPRLCDRNPKVLSLVPRYACVFKLTWSLSYGWTLSTRSEKESLNLPCSCMITFCIATRSNIET